MDAEIKHLYRVAVASDSNATRVHGVAQDVIHSQVSPKGAWLVNAHAADMAIFFWSAAKSTTSLPLGIQEPARFQGHSALTMVTISGLPAWQSSYNYVKITQLNLDIKFPDNAFIVLVNKMRYILIWFPKILESLKHQWPYGIAVQVARGAWEFREPETWEAQQPPAGKAGVHDTSAPTKCTLCCVWKPT
jgi:hypothetical protein